MRRVGNLQERVRDPAPLADCKRYSLKPFPDGGVASDRSFLRHCLSRVWCVCRCVRDKIRYSRPASLLYTCRGAGILGGDTSRRPLRKRKARRKVRSLPPKKQKINKPRGARADINPVAPCDRLRRSHIRLCAGVFLRRIFAVRYPARAEARAQSDTFPLGSETAPVCASIGMDIVGTDYRLRKERACECA